MGARARDGHHDLTLDMADVPFCDSTGLNAVLRVLQHAKAAGGSLTVADPSDQVKRLLSMCGLESLVSRPSARLDPARG